MVTVNLRKRKHSKKGKESLYLDIYEDGVRRYEYLGLYLLGDRLTDKDTLVLAKTIAAQRQVELQAAGLGQVTKQQVEEDFVEFFEALCATKGRGWQSIFLHIKIFQPTPIPLRKLSHGWLESLKDYLLDQVSANSADTYMNKVKAALNIAMGKGLVQGQLLANFPKVKKTQTARDYLSLEELQQLAVTPSPHDGVRKAFLFSCYTGLRLSDVQKLQWRDIRNGKIHFTQKKTAAIEVLPLHPALHSLLGAEGEASALIFDLPKSHWGIWDKMQQWSRAAGLHKHISFHCSRHTFATMSLEAGSDIFTVSKLLGHTDVRTTQIYAKIVDKRKDHVINSLPVIDALLSERPKDQVL